METSVLINWYSTITKYPVQYASVSDGINSGAPIIFDGCLPAGTTLNLYVDYIYQSGTLTVTADEEILSKVNFNYDAEKTSFNRGEYLSIYYPFAVSDKKISVTLKQAAETLSVGVSENLSVHLCGIEIILPEEYAVEEWYHASTYDVASGLAAQVGPYRKMSSVIMISPNEYQGSTKITIHENCSYTTGKIWKESNANTIADWAVAAKKVAGQKKILIRNEAADFTATQWTSMVRYYRDFFEMCAKNGFSWLSNDWRSMTQQHVQEQQILECPKGISYKGYNSFNKELLQLLQEYQSNERP